MSVVTCLAVLPFIAAVCLEDAPPIGDCTERITAVYDCTIHESELPTRASWYNPYLGGINCDSDCSTTGDGTPVEDCFNVCLACPIGWYGRVIDFGEGIGTWQCRDHGGAIKPHYGRIYMPGGFVSTWFITVDFMAYEAPPWAYMLLEWTR